MATSRKVRLGPDWAGIQPTNFQPSTRALPRNILIGDNKVGCKWKSRNIKRSRVDTRSLSGDWILPISQVYTYYINANARYGYIITDEELVALRISQMTEDGLEAWAAKKSNIALL